jgi:hypothetical protein
MRHSGASAMSEHITSARTSRDLQQCGNAERVIHRDGKRLGRGGHFSVLQNHLPSIDRGDHGQIGQSELECTFRPRVEM